MQEEAKPANGMYYFTELRKEGQWHESRKFNTKQAATPWAQWLLTLEGVDEVAVWRGAVGGDHVFSEVKSCKRR